MLTLLSSPSTLLSLSSTLHSIATNAAWSPLLSSEPLITIAHSLSMSVLNAHVPRCPTPKSWNPLPRPLPCPSNDRAGSHGLARFRAYFRRSAASSQKQPERRKAVSALKGTRASLLPPPPPPSTSPCWWWWWPFFSPPVPPKRRKVVSFHPTVCVKRISRCDLRVWDREGDLKARPYALPLRTVQFVTTHGGWWDEGVRL